MLKSIPLMKPNITEEDCEAVVSVLKSGMLVQGKKVQELEEKIKNYIGVKNAVIVSSGTATLHLALIASGITFGDEVIIPAFSYIATANVVELVGATPIFVDIDLSTFNIDYSQIENKITNKTKAIIPVHEFGLGCDIIEINKIAEKYNLKVIEDAACALGAKINNKFVGNFGNITSFSFHPRKAITGGEGGVLLTDNDEIAEKFRTLRNHGISFENKKMEFIDAGFNYRLTDIQASLILSQFNRFTEILEKKNRLSEIYFNELGSNSKITLPTKESNKFHSWQSFHILIEKRDLVIEMLSKVGIGTNYGAQCIPEQQFYKNKYKLNVELDFPNAYKAYSQGLVLPLYETLQEDDIFYIANNLNDILK